MPLVEPANSLIESLYTLASLHPLDSFSLYSPLSSLFSLLSQPDLLLLCTLLNW